MSKAGAVFRPPISIDEIMGTIEVIQNALAVGMPVPTGARSMLAKLRRKAFDIDLGLAVPAYVNTGAKKSGVTLEALGGEDVQDNTIRNLAAASVTTTSTSPKIGADLNESEEEELERLEREMLSGLAAMGNENVVLEERRKTPRNIPDTPSDDSALFKSL